MGCDGALACGLRVGCDAARYRVPSDPYARGVSTLPAYALRVPRNGVCAVGMGRRVCIGVAVQLGAYAGAVSTLAGVSVGHRPVCASVARYVRVWGSAGVVVCARVWGA